MATLVVLVETCTDVMCLNACFVLIGKKVLAASVSSAMLPTNTLVFGIVKRAQRSHCRASFPSDIHLPHARGHPLCGHAPPSLQRMHHDEAHCAPEGVAVAGSAYVPHGDPVPVDDLRVEEHRLGVCEDHLWQRGVRKGDGERGREGGATCGGGLP